MANVARQAARFVERIHDGLPSNGGNGARRPGEGSGAGFAASSLVNPS